MKHLIFGFGLLALLGVNACEKGTDGPREAVSYQNDIQNIVQNNCRSCHGGPAPANGLRLESYGQVREAAEIRNLVERINDIDNPMPPAGRLIQDSRDKIVQWVEDGFPEK